MNRTKQKKHPPPTKPTSAKTAWSKADQVATKKQRKPWAGSLVVDSINLFQSLPGFSFALLASDGTYVTGPSLASAVDLVLCAVEQWEYSGPHPDAQFRSVAAKARGRIQEIIATVEDSVRKLRAAKVSFILAWHAYGEKLPHLEWRGAYSARQVREKMFNLLIHEIEGYVEDYVD